MFIEKREACIDRDLVAAAEISALGATVGPDGIDALVGATTNTMTMLEKAYMDGSNCELYSRALTRFEVNLLGNVAILEEHGSSGSSPSMYCNTSTKRAEELHFESI